MTVAPNEEAEKYVAKGGTNRNTGSSIVGMTGDGNNETQLSMLRFDGLVSRMRYLIRDPCGA